MSHYVTLRWPFYLSLVGGGLAAVFLGLWVATTFQVDFLIPLSLLLIVILAYITFTSLWAAFLVFDQASQRCARMILTEGQIRPTDTVVYIYVSERRFVSRILSHLTLGRLWVVDIYTPQIMPGRNVARQREQNRDLADDPRLIERPGRIDLIPLQEISVDVIVLPQVLSAIEQDGDREVLLEEVTRLLKPNGRIVIVDQPRSWISRLSWFTPQNYMIPIERYRQILRKSRYVQQQNTPVNGFMFVIKAIKPTDFRSMQLPLDI